MNTLLTRALAAALPAVVATLQTLGAAFVRNPSFESNFNETWPHYSAVDEWSGASGVNDINYGNGGPFHNPGTPMPDRERVGFKQGGGDVTQEIYGLTPGAGYWLQLFYDARAGGGASEDLVVYFDDVEIGRAPNIRPSTGEYYFLNAPFVPGADFGIIRLHHIVAGDRTVLLDGIHVVARDSGNVVLRNPSFEASGTLPAVGVIPNLAGWSQTGIVGVDDGTGGYADNGTPPDQDLVAFIVGAGSISQPLVGLIAGTEYEVRLFVNAGSGSAPHLSVTVGDVAVAHVPVSPGAYQEVSYTFTAEGTDAVLTVAQTRDGADVLLLDDIRLLGSVRPPLAPMEFAPLVSEVGPGQSVAHAMTIPAAALDDGPVSVRLASSNPGIARLAEAAGDGTLTLTFTPGGPTTLPFSVETLRRGGVVVNVLESGRIPVPATPSVIVVNSLVKNASFETSVAPAFPGYGPVVGWQGTGNTGLNRAGGPNDPAGPFGDNGLVPDREQVAFIQGNGTLAQQITGLESGRAHWLQFRYNARDCCGERSQSLAVSFAGTVLADFPDLRPAAELGEVDYAFAQVAFTPTATEGLLEFVHEAAGDASVVLDAVSIVPRAADEVVIQNPSFEASGSPPGVGYLQPFQVAGWTGGAGGRGINVNQEGPFTDNGFVPDQDRAGFLQSVGASLSQVVSGLVSGQQYTLVLGINARNCCGGRPIARVSVAEVPLLEEEILPVGGATPYRAVYLPFTAQGEDVELRIEIAASEPEGADVSLLFDDIHLVPGNRAAPVITLEPESQDVSAGTTVILRVAATGAGVRYQWLFNGQPLTDGGRISGSRSDTLTVAGVSPSDAGTYQAHVSDGLGLLGSEPAVVTVEAGPELPVLQAILTASGAVRLSWPAGAVGFTLNASGTLVGTYAPVEDPVVVEGDENVVLVAASDEAGYFVLRP
ncbi:MAG: immunoglobulin domain-containing protein [Verrucomicrobiae bacterium]|nr:immunoglobulin domain-containing protein [Verrucomicrobiae bacterium]